MSVPYSMWCPHGKNTMQYVCPDCERDAYVLAREERRDDDMRETLIHLTAAFNRMADNLASLAAKGVKG